MNKTEYHKGKIKEIIEKEEKETNTLLSNSRKIEIAKEYMKKNGLHFTNRAERRANLRKRNP